MPLHANSHPWRAEREGLDILAHYTHLEDRLKMILFHAFENTPESCSAIFDEARAMGPVLRTLKRDAQSWYCHVTQVIEAYNAEE